MSFAIWLAITVPSAASFAQDAKRAGVDRLIATPDVPPEEEGQDPV